MYAQVERAKKSNSRANASSVAQMKGGSERSFSFVDNRPETIIQRQLKAMADKNSAAAHIRRDRSLPNQCKNSPLQLQLINSTPVNIALEQQRIVQYHLLEAQGDQRAVTTIQSNQDAIADYRQARTLRVQVMQMHIPGTDPGDHPGAVAVLNNRITQRQFIIGQLLSKAQSKKDKKNNQKPPDPGKGGSGGTFGTGSQASWLPGNQPAW